jgi:dUTP pyrophosphatase
MNIEIQFIKTHPDAVLPIKSYNDDNCFDITAVEDIVIPAKGSNVVPIGLTVAYITPGFGFAYKPRSGLGFKAGIQPHLGEIDNGYRGDLSVKLYNFSDIDFTVKKGTRAAQFKVEKVYETHVSFAEIITNSNRGENGLGSTDTK